ncbi:hypothetical protein BC629DRAFT_1597604 [Irpex lacteus]|nr:hypothetical protein BC629DRAFT_1597604 [Irpex lacteus]
MSENVLRELSVVHVGISTSSHIDQQVVVHVENLAVLGSRVENREQMVASRVEVVQGASMANNSIAQALQVHQQNATTTQLICVVRTSQAAADDAMDTSADPEPAADDDAMDVN